VLLPPACAVIGARMIINFFYPSQPSPARSYRELIGFGSILIVAAVVTFANVKFLTQGRVSEILFGLHNLRLIRWHAVESLVVTSPLLIGFVFFVVRYWRSRWRTLVILGLGALSSFVLYTIFDIPWWRNEYKFIFTAAVCLAPFPSLFLESWLDRLGRMTVPMTACLAVGLALPWAYNIYLKREALYMKAGPALDLRGFDMRLDHREWLAGMFDAIRERTPVNSLLVTENAELHFPTLTRRQLYVAPAQTEPHPGILISSDQMLTLVKGYSKEILEQRRSIVRGLFNPQNDGIERAQSLKQILKFNRPLVLVLDGRRDAILLDWLNKERKGRLLHQENWVLLWLVEPEQNRIDSAIISTR
jgi:hypothetical protein